MYRNMKIGGKIFLGYSFMLVALAVLAAIVITTNLTTSRNMRDTQDVSDLQTLGNSVLDFYNDARIGANSIYTATNDADYKRAEAGVANAYADLDKMDALIAGRAAIQSFAEPVSAIRASIGNWKREVDGLQSCTAEMRRLAAEMDGISQTLLTEFSTFSEDQKRHSEKILQDDNSTLTHELALIDHASGIETDVLSILQDAQRYIKTHDSATAAQCREKCDAVTASIEDYRGKANAQMREQAQAIQTTLSGFREKLNAYTEAVARGDKVIQTAKQTGLDASRLMETLVDDMDVSMSETLDHTTQTSTNALRIIVALSALGFSASVAMALIVIRSITRPMKQMQSAIEIVGSTGRMTLTAQEKEALQAVASRDEVGISVQAFSRMLDRLEFVSEDLSRVAQGDLSVKLEPISQTDTIGISVADMLRNLNEMFATIRSTAHQVKQGSNQLTCGAQSLAQGATEQSATVQQLSAALLGLTEQTKVNAALAGQAKVLGEEIKGSAESGSQGMEEMIQAVREITDSSQAIENVIKIIDDIAFQTNILALNASVEAARAGQHGKGFAVVADEVRNLATKSAEAARDTGELIAKSSEKAAQGKQITQKTAELLHQILVGIVDASEMVNRIAQASDEQAEAIEQISIGVEQVSTVVQQNSATAQESAAASIEMDGQAAELHRLIDRFRLASGV